MMAKGLRALSARLLPLRRRGAKALRDGVRAAGLASPVRVARRIASSRPEALETFLVSLAFMLLGLWDPFGLGDVTELRSEQAVFRVTSPFHGAAGQSFVTVVLLGEDYVEDLGGWPFSFPQYSGVVDLLSSLGASVVFLDVLLDTPRGGPEAAESFRSHVASLRDDTTVILPVLTCTGQGRCGQPAVNSPVNASVRHDIGGLCAEPAGRSAEAVIDWKSILPAFRGPPFRHGLVSWTGCPHRYPLLLHGYGGNDSAGSATPHGSAGIASPGVASASVPRHDGIRGAGDVTATMAGSGANALPAPSAGADANSASAAPARRLSDSAPQSAAFEILAALCSSRRPAHLPPPPHCPPVDLRERLRQYHSPVSPVWGYMLSDRYAELLRFMGMQGETCASASEGSGERFRRAVALLFRGLIKLSGAPVRDPAPCPYIDTLYMNQLQGGAPDYREHIRSMLEGRAVLVGVDLASMDDRMVNPVNGSLPSVYTVATVVENLMHFGERYPHDPPGWLTWAAEWLVLWLVLWILLLARRRVARAWPAAGLRGRIRLAAASGMLILLFPVPLALIACALYWGAGWAPINWVGILGASYVFAFVQVDDCVERLVKRFGRGADAGNV